MIVVVVVVVFAMIGSTHARPAHSKPQSHNDNQHHHHHHHTNSIGTMSHAHVQRGFEELFTSASTDMLIKPDMLRKVTGNILTVANSNAVIAMACEDPDSIVSVVDIDEESIEVFKAIVDVVAKVDKLADTTDADKRTAWITGMQELSAGKRPHERTITALAGIIKVEDFVRLASRVKNEKYESFVHNWADKTFVATLADKKYKTIYASNIEMYVSGFMDEVKSAEVILANMTQYKTNLVSLLEDSGSVLYTGHSTPNSVKAVQDPSTGTAASGKDRITACWQLTSYKPVASSSSSGSG